MTHGYVNQNLAGSILYYNLDPFKLPVEDVNTTRPTPI